MEIAVMQPDAVLAATGSNHIKPPIPGIDGEHVHKSQPYCCGSFGQPGNG